MSFLEFHGAGLHRSILTPERRAEVPRGLEELCFMDPIPNWEVQLPLPTLLSSEESPPSSLRSLNAWSRAKGSGRVAFIGSSPPLDSRNESDRGRRWGAAAS